MSFSQVAIQRPGACLLILVLLFSLCANAAVNITVDDQETDKLTYSPASAWVQGSTCTSCLVKPDPSQAYDGTWHMATTTPNSDPYTITLKFKGKDYLRL